MIVGASSRCSPFFQIWEQLKTLEVPSEISRIAAVMSAAIKFALAKAYEYVFSTVPVNAIQDEFYATGMRFLYSLGDTVVALLYLLVYTSLVLAKLVILVFPHAVRLGKVVVDFHMTKLSRSDLIIEATSISVLLTCFIFRKRIQRAWRNFIDGVSAKSKVAAKAAPHVLFFSTAIVFAIVGKNLLLPLTHSAVMPVFTLVLPLAETIYLLFQVKSMDEKSAQAAICAKNLLWVIVGIYHALVTFASLIPFSRSVLQYLPYAREMVIVVMVWVQLSPVFTRIVFESVISKIMVQLCALVPAGYNLDQTQQKTSTFVSVLKMMYLINDSQLSFLQALFQDSVATILAAVFVFTPNPFATVGAVIIAILLPAFRTSAVVASAAPASGATGELAKLARPPNGTGNSTSVTETAKKREKMQIGVDHVLSTHWLRYWVCFSVLWCVRIYVMNPWASVVIVSCLWLQHSYFQGSSQLTAFMVDAATAIAERNRRIEMERGWRSPVPSALGADAAGLTTPVAATPSRFSSLAGFFTRTPMKTPATALFSERAAVPSVDSKDALERNPVVNSSSGGSSNPGSNPSSSGSSGGGASRRAVGPRSGSTGVGGDDAVRA